MALSSEALISQLGATREGCIVFLRHAARGELAGLDMAARDALPITEEGAADAVAMSAALAAALGLTPPADIDGRCLALAAERPC
jgi:hypothetical protein